MVGYYAVAEAKPAGIFFGYTCLIVCPVFALRYIEIVVKYYEIINKTKTDETSPKNIFTDNGGNLRECCFFAGGDGGDHYRLLRA